MKHRIAGMIFDRVRRSPKLGKRLLLVLGIGVSAFAVIAVVGIWFSVAMVGKTLELAKSDNVTQLVAQAEEQMQQLPETLDEVPAVIKPGCIDQAQSMLSLQVWLEQPIGDNVKTLREACWSGQTTSS